MSTAADAPDRADAATAPTHGCVRCGASIPIHESMCESCNPLGLKAPSASQAHGIAIAGVAVARFFVYWTQFDSLPRRTI